MKEEQTEKLKKKIFLLEQENRGLRNQNEELKTRCDNIQASYDTVVGSQAWKMTAPLRRFLDFLKSFWLFQWLYSKRTKARVKKYGILQKDNAQKSNGISFAPGDENAYINLAIADRIDLITTPHTLFIAHLIESRLKERGIRSEIHVGSFDKFEDIPYIIICPQFLKKFPKTYAVFQMEQTVTSRWLTEDYLEILRHAIAVLDYSSNNIEYFAQYPEIAKKIFFVPIDVLKQYEFEAQEAPECDVLFYGDPHCPRRQKLLEELEKHFSVEVISNSFGEEIYGKIRSAKVLLNIHYYENSLLETTRLCEALSVGAGVIVSEESADRQEDERWKEYVEFVPCGDADALIERISYWLGHEKERNEYSAALSQKLAERKSAFDYAFGRFLLAYDVISFDDFYESYAKDLRLAGDRLCLSLPEAPERRKAFAADNAYGFAFFDGLKHRLGWIGAAMSYKLIFKKALEQGLESIMVCEDDVYFPEGFPERFAKAQQYLSAHPGWDVFSAFMADVSDEVQVKAVAEEQGETFVMLDRMISMVFNVYHRPVFSKIAGWDSDNRDVNTNTIDQYLENTDLNVLTTEPFLVGHKEELRSTIWEGYMNGDEIYLGMIRETRKKMKKIRSEFEEEKRNNGNRA